MTEFEHNCFDALNEEDGLSFFYKSWVRKEAVVKAWGKGIDDNLNQLDVSGRRPCGDDEQAPIHDMVLEKLFFSPAMILRLVLGRGLRSTVSSLVLWSDNILLCSSSG